MKTKTTFDPSRCDPLPDWAKWVACDPSGEWVAFENKPTEGPLTWVPTSANHRVAYFDRSANVTDWRETLTGVRDGTVVEAGPEPAAEPEIQPDTSLYPRNSPQYFRACALIAEGIARGEGAETYCEDGFRQWVAVKAPTFHDRAQYRLRKPPIAPDVVYLTLGRREGNPMLRIWSATPSDGAIKYVRTDK